MLVKFSKIAIQTIAALISLVFLLVAILMLFPALIKTPIEQQLSKFSDSNITISKPYFDFNQANLILHIDNIDAVKKQTPIVNITNLVLNMDFSSLLKDGYISSKLAIDALTLYADSSLNKTQHYTAIVEGIEVFKNEKKLDFLKSISIDKTVIKDEKKLDIAPILLTHNKLKIIGQDLGFNTSNTQHPKVNIDIDLVNILSDDASLTVPILISNDELSIQSEAKFFNKKGDIWFEFKSDLDKVRASSLAAYLSMIVDDDIYTWIKQGFVAGTLQNIQLRLRKNLSKLSDIDVQVNTRLKDVELLFHPNWETLKKLNASLSIKDKKMMLKVDNMQFNGMVFNDVKAQIADLGKKKLALKINTNIHTQSEQLIDFLKRAPLTKEENKILHQFELYGKIDGKIQLFVPLDERKSILDIDLLMKDNRLTLLGGSVVVKDYNSKLRFHDNEITTAGTGNIRGLPFNIRINPNHKNKDNENSFEVELVNTSSGFKSYIAKQLDQSWRIKIESKLVKGNIAVFLNEGELPTVRVSDVKITTLDAIRGDWDISPKDLPSMNLSTQRIFVNKRALPDFKVKLIATDKSLIIKNLQFEGIEFDRKALNFQGVWIDGRTRIFAKTKGENLAEFLKNLKIKEKVTGGAFNFDVRLACECAPWKMNYKNITGYLDLNVKKGVFMDQDPNIGRVLSLINIGSIAKRLKLDISDATNKGFAYENIETQIYLGNAIASIENFKLESLSSQITLTGTGDIVKQEYDLVAKVIPAVGDAIPVATYLAGGGLIGLGVWLIDNQLFKGKMIDGIVSFKYKITGPWEKPIIKDYD
ncbi:YhdP family protein [Bathymodiolus septemdierum thioautotrophic gill symbiont]|uniref:YhdP central domain-containing protein n=1 Tax=endosymbiont of Bathymodiolus septemdierum str. Myojin knoll TaxID=1303921 RepID=A0A0P0URB5_9GAMM|nr:DUF3971 domain-containing protein [Bathymodiolus septemdierum thioautotrophic gill symbiont]BAS67373.1 conserved hypothetical protein [endosymbiont of Bathymodiolus septemdierum str. Myojin knoll]